MGKKLKNIILLQGVVMVYTFSGIMSKKASQNGNDIVKFLTFLALEFVVLAIYGLLWQQVIKYFELSVAYANRSMAILWSMLWAVVFFDDMITGKNILGVLLVLVGTIIINMDTKDLEETADD